MGHPLSRVEHSFILLQRRSAIYLSPGHYSCAGPALTRTQEQFYNFHIGRLRTVTAVSGSGVVWRYLPSPLPLDPTPTPTTLSISLRSSLLLPIPTIVQNVQFIYWSTKRGKVLDVMGKTILKLFTQYSIQQNVRIDMLTADAWSSTVLHVQGPTRNTPHWAEFSSNRFTGYFSDKGVNPTH